MADEKKTAGTSGTGADAGKGAGAADKGAAGADKGAAGKGSAGQAGEGATGKGKGTTGKGTTGKGAAGAGKGGSAARADAPQVPEYELSSYDPVAFEMPRYEVSDEQVEAQMRTYADKMALDYVEAAPRPVGPKDTVKIDLEVDKDGEPLKGICSEDRLYTMGEGFMPIGFDRGLLDMEPGQTREFDFDAPDLADDADMAERPFHAKVALKAVMDKEDPEFTDEWVKEHLPLYKSADDFREQMRLGIEAQGRQAVEQEKNARAVQALSERFDGSIDDYFYEVTREELVRGYEAQARQQGMDLEDFLGKQGIDQQQFSMMLMMQVRETLVQGYALDAWARHYGIEASDEDVQELANMMSQGHAQEFLEQVRQDDPELEGMRTAARRYAANKDLVAKAQIS